MKKAIFINAGCLITFIYLAYQAGSGIPDQLTNQDCCKGKRKSNGECCYGDIENSKYKGEYCAFTDDNGGNVAEKGIVKDLYFFMISSTIIFGILTLYPYHDLKTLDDLSIICGNLFGLAYFYLMIHSNIILGYGLTVPCQNPDTRQFFMIKDHMPLEFGFLVIMAYLGPLIISLVIVGLIFSVIISYCVYFFISFYYNPNKRLNIVDRIIIIPPPKEITIVPPPYDYKYGNEFEI